CIGACEGIPVPPLLVDPIISGLVEKGTTGFPKLRQLSRGFCTAEMGDAAASAAAGGQVGRYGGTGGQIRWTKDRFGGTGGQIRWTKDGVGGTGGQIRWTKDRFGGTGGQVQWADGQVRRAGGMLNLPPDRDLQQHADNIAASAPPSRRPAVGHAPAIAP